MHLLKFICNVNAIQALMLAKKASILGVPILLIFFGALFISSQDVDMARSALLKVIPVIVIGYALISLSEWLAVIAIDKSIWKLSSAFAMSTIGGIIFIYGIFQLEQNFFDPFLSEINVLELQPFLSVLFVVLMMVRLYTVAIIGIALERRV
tara:strand:- start:5944 stop:6399 length:456 start_codon:yes stop_codon:yes gene_type:complete